MPRKAAQPEDKRCSFCKRKEADVARLIAGLPGHAICDECIDLCYAMLQGEDAGVLFSDLPTHGARPSLPPKDLYARRKANGDGGLEAIRVLKRHLSNTVYRALLTDAETRIPIAA